MHSLHTHIGLTNVIAGLLLGVVLPVAAELAPVEQLGKALFFDTNLSRPAGQSCASCHAPETGWTSPDATVNSSGAVVPGAIPSLAGNRKPPSVAYNAFAPIMHMGCGCLTTGCGCMGGGGMGGGGMGGGGMGGGGMGGGGGQMGNVNLYRNLGLTDMELMGLAVFNNKAKCSACHRLTSGSDNTPPLFTDFRYHNLGIPKNPENPFYHMPRKYNPSGDQWIDPGLGGFLAQTEGWVDAEGISRDGSAAAAENWGKHRTPTLRNVDLRPSPDFTKAYGHNGHFKDLMSILHFYNTRDTLPVCEEGGTPGVDCWPPPEVAQNINTTEMGNLGLNPQEGMAIIAFMKTLSDGFVP